MHFVDVASFCGIEGEAIGCKPMFIIHRFTGKVYRLDSCFYFAVLGNPNTWDEEGGG